MFSLINYFEFKEQPKNLLVLASSSEAENFLRVFLERNSLESLLIVGEHYILAENIKKNLEESPGLLEGIETVVLDYSNFRNWDREVDTVIFDTKAKLDMILACSRFEPKYVLGKIWRDYTPYFPIWEKFRTIRSSVHIVRSNVNNTMEVLDWEYNPDNPIELSIVFPVYNVESYLAQCIESVTDWKASYVEFIFVNDGSPDKSRDIIMEYAQKDSRIILVDKANGGCASARKVGLANARGRYVGFVDPDDFVDTSMFRRLFARALMGGYEISYCGYNEYYGTTGTCKKVADTIGVPYSCGTTDVNIINQLMMFCRVAIWRGIYKADFLRQKKITFNEAFRRYDDLPFKIEVFACAKSVVAVPEYLYYYRLERPGQDMSCTDDRLYIHFDIFNYLNKRIACLNSRKLLDYLQICKIQTHCFALQRIESKYKKTYAMKARKDLLTNNMSVLRTIALIRKYIGTRTLKTYLKIMMNMV